MEPSTPPGFFGETGEEEIELPNGYKKIVTYVAIQDPSSEQTTIWDPTPVSEIIVMPAVRVVADPIDNGSGSPILDGLQTVLDVVGIFDPTVLVDGVNATIYAFRGQGSDALIAAAGMVPYFGDFAKGGKYGAKAFKAGNKIANQQITSVANEFGIPRKEFSTFVHQAKRMEGRGGSDNFTYNELKQLAQKFLEHQPNG